MNEGQSLRVTPTESFLPVASPQFINNSYYMGDVLRNPEEAPPGKEGWDKEVQTGVQMTDGCDGRCWDPPTEWCGRRWLCWGQAAVGPWQPIDSPPVLLPAPQSPHHLPSTSQAGFVLISPFGPFVALTPLIPPNKRTLKALAHLPFVIWGCQGESHQGISQGSGPEHISCWES